MFQVLFTFVVPYDLVEAVLLEFQNQVNKSNCMDPVQPHFFSLNQHKRNGWTMFAWLSYFILFIKFGPKTFKISWIWQNFKMASCPKSKLSHGNVVTWQNCCMTMFSHGPGATWQSFHMAKLSQGKVVTWQSCHMESCYMEKLSLGKVVTWQSCHMENLSHGKIGTWQSFHRATLLHGKVVDAQCFVMSMFSHATVVKWQSLFLHKLLYKNLLCTGISTLEKLQTIFYVFLCRVLVVLENLLLVLFPLVFISLHRRTMILIVKKKRLVV